MNPTLELNFWWRLLGILALEMSLVVALAFAAQSLTQSAFWRRTIWQSCLVCLLLLVTSDITGLGRGMAVWFAGQPPVERKVSVRIAPADEQFIPSPIENEILPPMAFSEEEAPVPHPVWWPGILWLSGLGLIFARILFARILFVTLRWRKAEITDALLLSRVSELAHRLGIRRKIHLLESPGFSSPMTFGIAQPNIGLPAGFARNFSSAEQNAMLTHELAHVAARDPLWYLLADLASALLWWHPLVWLTRRRLHSASELAADEAAAILENGPGTLAECLVNLGQRMTQSRSFGWLGVDGNGFRSHLAQRVERLLNLKKVEKQTMRGWPLFFVKTTGTILLGSVIIFTAGWMQNGKELHEKNLSAAVQKSWNGSFASTALAALAVERKELMAKNERQTSSKISKFSQGKDMLSFETMIYENFSGEQLEEIKEILEPSFALLPSNQREGVLILSSNSLLNVLFALSKFRERMISPWDCGRFIAPFDMVGSKFSGVQTIYSGNPTNRGGACMYTSKTENGVRVITRGEMSYQTSNAWRFSLVPQKRNDSIEINLVWTEENKETKKQWKMPNDGGAVVQHRFSDDPSRNQLIVFSSLRLPRMDENKSDQKNEKRGETGRPRVELVHPTIPPKTVQNSTFISRETKSPPANPAARTNLIYTSKGRQAIKAKLDRIHFSEIQFEHLPLGEVLKSLRDESKKMDPDHLGINFLFNPHPNSPVAPTNDPKAAVIPPASSAPVDLDEITIHINPALKDLRLADVLDAIVQVANKPLQYTILDYGVCFSPKVAEDTAFYSRIFRVKPKTFLQALESVTGSNIGVQNSTGGGGGGGQGGAARNSVSSVSKTNLQTKVNQLVKAYFTAAGVDFGATTAADGDRIVAPNGKALFFNDRTGLLMVKASLPDLEIIQTAIEVLTAEPPQVTIETKFAEINEPASRTIDWEQLLSGSDARMITNSDSGFKLLDGLTNWPKAFPTHSLANSITRNFTTILTEKQFETVLQQIQNQAGTDVLTSPNATTLSGRRVQVSVEDEVNVRARASATEITLKTGPSLDIIPLVSDDGYSIQMPVIATVQEILQEKRGVLRKKISTAKIRQMSTTANVYDGQTLVLGELTNGKNPGSQRLLFVFVTAKIIDSKGERLHTEFPLATNSVPKQPDQK